jgi:hypothetical protein
MIRPVLQKYLPNSSVDYCVSLWEVSPFNFKVTKKRESKLGDYRYEFAQKKHSITVNGDLNPFTFLVTYLHEVAHLRTQLQHGGKVKPHGNEWKNEFKKLLYPLMSEEFFPASILLALKKYLANPKASSCTDIHLLKALRAFDTGKGLTFLSDIDSGVTFRFNKKYFIKESIVRTRALCREVKTGRRFYIPVAAEVEVVQLSLFS